MAEGGVTSHVDTTSWGGEGGGTRNTNTINALETIVGWDTPSVGEASTAIPNYHNIQSDNFRVD